MSDSESNECYDKFTDAVIDITTILAPTKITPLPSFKKNNKLPLTEAYRELLSRQLYDTLESSLKIKKTKSPNNASIELQEDDVTLFKSSHVQESKKNSIQTLKELTEKTSKKRKISSSESDDDSENMEKFRMAAMTGEMLSSARFAMSGGRQPTNTNSTNCSGKNENHLFGMQGQNIKDRQSNQ